MTEPTRAADVHATGHGSPDPRAVDRYCEDLLLALRLRDVPGDRIGAVLAEVRDHLTSSGEDPVGSFGTAQDYAAALTPERAAPTRSAQRLEAARNAAGVAGLLWAAEGGTALLSGEQAVLTEFQVVPPVLIALVAPRLLDAVAQARRPALIGWGALVTAAVVALALVHAWTGPLLGVTLPPAALLVPGLVVAAAWIVTTARAVDPVVAPLQDAVDARRQRRRGSASFVALMLLLLLVPVVVAPALRHLG